MNSESNYWEWFFQYFDKIILLDRQNKTLQSESFLYHMSMQDSTSWHRKQFYNLNNISHEQINDISKNLL